jgi:hypothetical protein
MKKDKKYSIETRMTGIRTGAAGAETAWEPVMTQAHMAQLSFSSKAPWWWEVSIPRTVRKTAMRMALIREE